MFNDLKFDEFKNLSLPSKKIYYKFYKNIQNSFSRVYNKTLTEKEKEKEKSDDPTTYIDDKIYSLKEFYPLVPTTTKDKEIISYQEPAQMTVDYDKELQEISEGLMSEFWLTSDKNEYKVDKKPECKYVFINKDEKNTMDV